MITTITLNPAIDRTVILDHFEYGSVNKAASSREDMGGKGINVARILLALGEEAVATGFLGKQNSGHTLGLMQQDHINCDMVMVDATTRTNTKLAESASGTTTDINEPGFFISHPDLEQLKSKIIRHCSTSAFAVFSGSVPPGLSADTYRNLISLLPKSCRPVLDADGDLLLEGLKARPFVIKPNIHELENTLGQKLTDSKAIIGAARQLIVEYGIQYVLVSKGGDGSILVTRNRAIKAAPIPVEVKGTVGAGDTMLAAFIYSLSNDQSDEQALANAAAAGALAVSQAGTQVISKQDMQNLAKQAKLTIIEN